MKKGWEPVQLGDIATVSAGNSAPQDITLFENGVYPFVRTSDVGKIHFGSIHESADKLNEKGIKKLRLFKKGTILFPKSGASTFLNHRVILARDSYVASHLATIKANPICAVDEYLLYFLFTIKAQDLIQDHSYPSLNISTIQNITIPLPPLPEQKRIVAILDEAFAGIEAALANTAKNLTNARELFESYLDNIFNRRGAGWEKKKLGDVMSLQYGKALPEENRIENGCYPVYGANGIKCYTNDSYWNKPSIIIGRKGSAGEINLVDAGFWPLDVTYYVTFDEKKYDLKFLYYRLKTLNLPSLAKGVKPGINRNDIYSIEQLFPPLPEQKRIVAQLDELSAASQRLETIYRQKQQALEELKQAMLHKAFSGELTAQPEPLEQITTA